MLYGIYILCSILLYCDSRIVNESTLKLSVKDPITLDEFLTSAFSSRTWNGTWLSDTVFLYRNLDGDYLKFDLETRSSEVFLNGSVLSGYPGATISISYDHSFVLIRFNVSSVYRHSTTASYTIYDIVNQTYYNIANLNPVQLVTFAPTGHGLVYVFENNIYYLEDFAADVANPVAVTYDGVKDIFYCGVPDWVYEEEVFGSGSALWFSPDATHLAYATFNDTQVADFSFYIYGSPGSISSQYPTEAKIKYPKVGSSNPLVNVYVYNMATKETLEFQLPPTISNKEPNNYVLFDLTWVSNTDVAMISTNRVQNESIIIRCTIEGPCTEEESHKEEHGWVNPWIPKYSKDGKNKLEILPQVENEDKFNHLVLTDLENGTKTRLTYGKRVVTTIYGWNEESGEIYYVATVNNTPSQQHVYVVSTDGSERCMSCKILTSSVNCTYATASFSTSLSYHATICNGPHPWYVVLEHSKNDNDVIVWEDNRSVRDRLALKLRPLVKNLEIPINEKFTARARLFLPPNLNETSKKKYPAIVNTYGGPNANQILDSFSLKLEEYLTTTREYIYIYIDARGSGRDGQNKMFQMYKKFATVEIEDQISVTKYLQDNLPYIDANRTGIWGWSYGGFASSWILAKDTERVFSFAVAIAPVTSFIYYDTIYTERYMGLATPEDNENGYNASDLTRVVEAFRGRNYFIIHGNADDNVHYQNSMLLVKALERNDIDFRQQSYPDENHSLRSVSKHLYHTIDKYWARCFDVEGPAISTWQH